MSVHLIVATALLLASSLRCGSQRIFKK